MIWRIPNLLSTKLDHRHNHEMLDGMTTILERDKDILVRLKSDLRVDSWDPDIWDLSQPHEDFNWIYVHSSFKEKKLITLPVNLRTGLEGQLYGVAYLNADLEQDQMTNAFLLGFPQQNGIVPVTLFDIIETQDKSIEIVDLYTAKP